MMRGDWDALGKNGAAASVTSLLCVDHEKFDADEGKTPRRTSWFGRRRRR